MKDVPAARRPPDASLLRAPADATLTVDVYDNEAPNTFDTAPILAVRRPRSAPQGRWMHAIVARSIAVCCGFLSTPTTVWLHKLHAAWQAKQFAAASIPDRRAGRFQRTLNWFGGQGPRIWNSVQSLIYVAVFVPVAGKKYSAAALWLLRQGAAKSLYVGHVFQVFGSRVLRHLDCADCGVDDQTAALPEREIVFYTRMREFGCYGFVFLPLQRIVDSLDFLGRNDSGFSNYKAASPALLAAERFWQLSLVSLSGDRSLNFRPDRPAASGLNMYLVGGSAAPAPRAARARPPRAVSLGPARHVGPAAASSFCNSSLVDAHLDRRYISHDYAAIAATLTRRFTSFTGAIPFDRIRAILEPYTFSRLTSTFWWILQGDASRQRRFSLIVAVLRAFFVLRFKPRRLVRAGRLSIEIPFVDKALDDLGLPRIITAAAEDLLPDEVKHVCGLPRIVFRYGSTQGVFLDLRGSSVASREDRLAQLKLLCTCSSIDHAHRQPNKFFDEPHMATTEFFFFGNAELTAMLDRGVKFRGAGVDLEGEGDVATQLASFIEARINKFCASAEAATRLRYEALEPFCSRAISDVRAALAGFEPDDEVSTLSGEARRVLKAVQRQYFLRPCDKAPDRFCVVCKYAYARAAWGFLKDSSATFVPEAGRSALEVAEAITAFVDTTGVVSKPKAAAELPNDGIATLYFTIKLLKEPIALRPICGGTELAITPLSKCLAAALGLVVSEADRMCDAAMSAIGLFLERSPILLGCEEFGEHLGLLNRLLAQGVIGYDTFCMITCDVRSMYTAIPQALILAECEEVVEHAFRRARLRLRGDTCYLHVPLASRVGRDAPFFSNSQTPVESMRGRFVCVDCETLKSWMRFVVSNCFFTFGGVLFHQQVGLPMGDNASVAFANLTLFSLEFKFLLRLVQCYHGAVGPRRKVLRSTIISVTCSMRLVDDRFDVAVEGLDSTSWRYFDATTDGFYPRSFRGVDLPIELEDVDVSGRLVNYLDLTVWKDARARRLAFCLFDKRRVGRGALFFREYRTFPHLESLLSRTCRHGVVTSQIIRFTRRCSRMRDFVREASDFLVRFVVGGGYPSRLAFAKFRRVVTGTKWKKTLGQPQTAVLKVKSELLRTPFFRRR